VQNLHKPDAVRLRKQLSAIINFAKFREEKLGPYSELQERAEGLHEEKADLEDVNAQLASSAPTRTDRSSSRGPAFESSPRTSAVC
jgi:kinetochore protein Nuf2